MKLKRHLSIVILVFTVMTFPVLSGDFPDTFPTRIILNLTATPQNSMAVTWRTDVPVKKAVAYIVESNSSVSLKAGAILIEGKSQGVPSGSEQPIGYAHSVIFSDLKPGTLYAYKVGDGDVWSEWNQFKTAQAGDEPFHFVFLGDPQNELIEYVSRIFRSAYRYASDASFWLMTGDLVTSPRDDDEWRDFYYAAGWIPGNMPMIMTPGNHEYYAPLATSSLTPLWKPQFTLPENGPASLGESCYFIDYQGARFISLNGNEGLETQARWLDSLLAKTSANWTIVMMHQPLYSTAKGRDGTKHRDTFQAVFDRHHVDLVLQGHDHAYGRSYPIRNGEIAGPGEKGTVYVVSVSGPKTYEMNRENQQFFVKMDTGKQWFQVIDVSPKQLKYVSYTVNGEIFDSFVLTK